MATVAVVVVIGHVVSMGVAVIPIFEPFSHIGVGYVDGPSTSFLVIHLIIPLASLLVNIIILRGELMLVLSLRRLKKWLVHVVGIILLVIMTACLLDVLVSTSLLICSFSASTPAAATTSSSVAASKFVLLLFEHLLVMIC